MQGCLPASSDTQALYVCIVQNVHCGMHSPLPVDQIAGHETVRKKVTDKKRISWGFKTTKERIVGEKEKWQKKATGKKKNNLQKATPQLQWADGY